MANIIHIKVYEKEDIPKILEVLQEPHMLERRDYFINYINRCYEENISGKRITFVAYVGNVVAGYVNIIYQSDYPYFIEKGIPEINDLYVTPSSRKMGVGKKLIDTCEGYALEHGYSAIGLGVGLYKDYGSAQRLYTKNGYQLDGNGLMSYNKPVNPGTSVFVDDELLLYLYKELNQEHKELSHR